MSLRFSVIQDTGFHNHINNHKKTLYLYSTNKPKTERNPKMLHKLSSETKELVALVNANLKICQELRDLFSVISIENQVF